VQQALSDFVIGVAPTLPLAQPGRYVTPVVKHTVPGVPFEVSVHRESTLGIQRPFAVVHLVDSSLEQKREDRIREACARKFPKLAAWRAKAGARTVLVLEDNDIQLTNPERVWQAYLQAESGFTDRPDEVWLVMTMVDELWWACPLRIDDRDYYANATAERWPEYDSAKLDDLSALARRL
jgi:hypothetical protein